MSETYPPSISSSSSSSTGDEAEWLDVAAHKNGDRDHDHDQEEEDEEEQVRIVSLIDNKVFSDVGAMLAYVRDKGKKEGLEGGEGGLGGLDFLGVRDRLGLDFYGMVRLVNFGEFFLLLLL